MSILVNHKYGMREIIRILESQLGRETMEEVYDLISSYVSHGEIGDEYRDYFDQVFEKIMNIVQRPTASMTLFRVLRLSNHQIEKIKTGGLVLEMRKFSSWTKDHDAAKRLAALKRGDDGATVIVSAKFPKREIVIDVCEFYESNHLTQGFDEYWRYVRPEKEVIVNHHAPIRLTLENTEISVIDTGHIDQWPQIGDKFFFEDSEDAFEIEDVDHDQPYASRGIFYVFVDQYGDMPVRKIGPGEWEAAKDFYGE